MRPLGRVVLLTGRAILAAVAIHAGTALAQRYPARPVHIVLPFTPGGEFDNLARLLAQNMTEVLGGTVLVENRPGADGRIGAAAVAKSAPDGHTILLTTGILAIGPSLYRSMLFDAEKDFARVTQLTSYPLLLVAGTKVPATSVGELVALAKSKPGALNYAHAGLGTQQYLGMELLKLSTGIDIQAIPYKGGAPMQIALAAGEVQVAFIAIASGSKWVKAGRARALGVSTARRSRLLPDVPTVAEAGVTGFEVDGQQVLFVPAKTPRDIIGQIQQAAVKVLNTPNVRSRLEALGSEIIGSTPEEFDAKFKADLVKYAKLVKDARIPVQD